MLTMDSVEEEIYKDVRKEAPKKNRTLIKLAMFIVVAGALIGAVVFFSSRLDTSPSYSGGKALGKTAPDIELTTLSGEKIKLSDFRGQRVMVNFFNSWCIPCQEELPALSDFAKEHASDPDFVFIGIVRDDSEKNIRLWTKANKAPFEVVFDKTNEAKIAFGTTGQPETYAIDRDGNIVSSLLSRASVKSLNEMWDATK